MYKRIKKLKLGRKTAHRKSLIHNLLRSLFENNFVVTTSTKAKALKQKASSLISKSITKKDDLLFRRELQDILGNDELVKKLKEYTSKDKTGIGIVKVGFRAGDNAEQSRVYLLGTEKKRKVEKKEDEKEVKKVTTEEKKKVNIDKGKKVDTSAVIRRTERAKSRSGL